MAAKHGHARRRCPARGILLRMMTLLLRLLALGAVFFLMPKVLTGVRVKSFVSAVVTALVFSLLNVLFGWLLKVLLIGLTLGLAFFALNFLVNTILLWATDKV